MTLFRLGNLYVKYISIDNCDNEISIHFTNKIENAKRFNLDESVYINILKELFCTDFELVDYIEVKE